uniref:Uncharacterized protein n=2 Tax=Sphaerodactylus townsendi TaxID=933632 RepID=A0ACB8FMT4_9SAUR
MNDMERAPRLSLETSRTASIQRSLTSTDAKQTSALDKAQLTDMSTMSGGNLFNHFVLKKVKTGNTVSKILTDPHSIISVQNPTASSESSPLSEKLAKEGGEKFWNVRSEVTQQSKDCLCTPDKNITDWNKGNNISSSSSLAVPEAGLLQRSFVTGNSCTVGRACSLEELETSLALWKKGPSASLNDHFGESAERNIPDELSNCGKSSIAVVKNETTLSSFPSSLGQKLDAINSNSLKSSEPQVAIVSPLILTKDGIQNEVQEKNLSSVLETMYPVIAVGSIHSLNEFVDKMSDIDKPVKRTACSPSDSWVTVKEVCPDIHQKITKSTGENGMQTAETEADCSCDPNQRITGPLQSGKNTPGDGFPPETDDSSSPVSQKCSLKTSPDLVKPEDTVLNKNIFQISSVCTLVQGDAFYNSQIASIFNSPLKSKAENNTSSEDQRPDSFHKERPLSLVERDCEINERASVGDASLRSLTTLSKAIAEKLLNLPGAKISQRGKVSDEVNESNSKGRKITELCNPNSEKDPPQNRFCSDIHSTDSASGNREVPGNSIVDEGSAHSVQEHVPSDETQTHSVNNIDIAPTSPNDQLSELLKEFPYGIYDSKVLNKTENEDSATKLIEIKEGQENQTFGQNSDANHSLDQITVNILNPQQMKELFPDSSGQSFNRLENRENDKVSIMSEGAIEKHIVDSTNSSAETVQEPASQSYCCLKGWISVEYNVDPCDCRLQETSSKQQLGHYLPSEIIIKEEPETHETSNMSCQLNNLPQTIDPVNNNLSSKDASNRIWSKSIHRENNLQQKENKPLKEDEGLIPSLSLEKSESLKPENKQQKIEKSPKKVQTEMYNQKCTTLVSKRKELLHSERDCSKGQYVRPACKRELSGKERTPRETVGSRSKLDTLRQSMENKHSKKKEQYKIKQESSETHIIKGPIHLFKRRLKKHTSIEGKQKTSKRPFSMVTPSSSLSSVDLVSKTYNNAQRSQEHLNRQKCKIDQGLENNTAVRTDHNESSSSEAVQQNKGSLVWTNLKKFVYPEERGKVWQNRRSLSGNIKTSKLQIFRRQHLNTYKSYSSGKEAVRGSHKRDKGFPKTHSDKKSPYDKKSNTLTLQREQNKNYLNKVGFRQTERSICLTKLVQSPSKSVWHVKSSSASEQSEDKKNYTRCSQQSEVIKPQMLEFKMCPEIVFKKLVSEEVPDAKKLSEKETTPVAAVKSTREDWLNYIPLKKRKIWEKETQVDGIPLGTAVELLDKDEASKKSNATFETYRKMHLEKRRSRSLDSSPLN